jgi:hypothetical protein
MFEDGLPAVHPEEEGRMRAFDVAELLDQAVFGTDGRAGGASESVPAGAVQ